MKRPATSCRTIFERSREEDFSHRQSHEIAGDVLGGGSFASSSDPRVLFGLGDASMIDLVEVLLPDGKQQTVKVTVVNAIYKINQLHGLTNIYETKRPAHH